MTEGCRIPGNKVNFLTFDQPRVGKARKCILVHLFVATMDTAEGKGVVDLVYANTAYQDHTVFVATALSEAHACPLQKPICR